MNKLKCLQLQPQKNGTANVAPQFKKILEQQAQDYSIDYGLYTEPGVPHYDGREILLSVTGLSDYVTGHGACNNL